MAGILIAGIGNIFLGDDGFGCEVAARLARRIWAGDVHVMDFGIRGLDLAYALSRGIGTAILVDAVPRGGKPGTVYIIEPDLCEPVTPGDSGYLDAHAMDPVKVIAWARSMSDSVGRILIVGCEPSTFGPDEGQMGLSEPVAAAVDEAVNAVEQLVRELMGD
jgi:hydrogenase maturation protease